MVRRDRRDWRRRAALKRLILPDPEYAPGKVRGSARLSLVKKRAERFAPWQKRRDEKPARHAA